MYANITNPANFQLQDFAQFGFRVITTDFIPVPGEQYRTLYVLQDAVVTATTQKGDDITSKAILAGTLLHGLFNSVSITSGRVLAYAAGRVTAEEIIALYESYVSALGGTLENTQCAIDTINEDGVDLFADASLVMIPEGYGTGVVYGQRPLTSDSQLTFTRASDATRVGPDGAIAVVGSNVPRIDYTGGGCGKLLLEPQTTALNQFSEQLNNAYWSLSRTSAFGSGSVVNAVTSPDGTQSAEYVQQASGQTSGGGAFVAILNSTGNYTISVFAKMAEQRYLRLGGALGASGVGLFCNFDLQDGVAGTPSAGVTPKIDNYGNGWYRCSITASKVDLTGNLAFFYQANTLNGPDATPLSGLYLWGANVTQTAYPTSYIPTLGSTVTRLADACSKTGIASLIGQTQGTLFAEVNVSQLQGAVGRTFIDIGSAGNRVFVGFTSLASNTIRLQIDAAGVPAAVDFRAVVSSTGTIKVAAAYKTGECALYVNGVAGTLLANGAISFTTISDLFLGQTVSGTAILGDGISQALLFKTRLSNEQLQTLTSL
jgi:hypothetical protein